MKSNAVDVPADPVEEPTAPLNSSTNSSDDDGGPVLLILEEQKVRFKLKSYPIVMASFSSRTLNEKMMILGRAFLKNQEGENSR